MFNTMQNIISLITHTLYQLLTHLSSLLLLSMHMYIGFIDYSIDKDSIEEHEMLERQCSLGGSKILSDGSMCHHVEQLCDEGLTVNCMGKIPRNSAIADVTVNLWRIPHNIVCRSMLNCVGIKLSKIALECGQ
ncbi:hypothetical protein PLEI_1455 [Photobacterium leiognathi lrivu.4.1]|uniref:Uncharacterized protein n=1 Tax=Photobacterium leiognathi lrivu.4.1 TaxID=1248232 RepID=A0A0U1P5D3_PHOLE|nr:hypothetical protein PLEI_1455 [Photobacterium leiognathi lrivu.4.1]